MTPERHVDHPPTPAPRSSYVLHGATPGFDVTAAAGTVTPLNANTDIRILNSGNTSGRSTVTVDAITWRVVGGPGAPPPDAPTSFDAACGDPTITAAATTANGNAYVAGTPTNQAVTVTFTCAPGSASIATCSAPAAFSTDGTYSATGTATDTAGRMASTTFGLIVIDRTAPVCTAAATPNVLRPPNKQMIPVSVTVGASDGGSGLTGSARQVALTSNEGNPSADQQGFTAGTVRALSGGGTATFTGALRAVRDGNGPGRVYTLTFEVTDGAGNAGRCTATISVPHDQSK